MSGIPKELDEAAMIDGANKFQIYYKLIISSSDLTDVKKENSTGVMQITASSRHKIRETMRTRFFFNFSIVRASLIFLCRYFVQYKGY